MRFSQVKVYLAVMFLVVFFVYKSLKHSGTE